MIATVLVGLLATATALRLPAAMGVAHVAASSRHATLRCQAADEPTAEIIEPAAAIPEAAMAPARALNAFEIVVGTSNPSGVCEFCGAAEMYGGCNGEGRCATPWHSLHSVSWRAGRWNTAIPNALYTR